VLGILLSCYSVAAGILFETDFAKGVDDNWIKPSKGINIVDGAAEISSNSGQRLLISKKTFKFVIAEFDVKFDKISSNSSIFYYLGFQDTADWNQNSVWLAIQDSVVFAFIKNGKETAKKEIGHIEKNKNFTFKIIWNKNLVEFYINGVSCWYCIDKDIIPQIPLQFVSGVNATGSQPGKCRLKQVKISDNPKKLQAKVAKGSKGLLINENFKSGIGKAWSGLATDIKLDEDKGILTIAPKASLRMFSTRQYYKFVNAEYKVTFNEISNDSSVFYYLGFQNIKAWRHDVIWIMVQDGNMIAGVRNGDIGNTSKTIGSVKKGKEYTFRIEWTPAKVEYFIDGKSVFKVTDPNIIPVTAMPFQLSANTMCNQMGQAIGKKAVLTVKEVKLWKSEGMQAAKTKRATVKLPDDKLSAGQVKMQVANSQLSVENKNYRCEFALGTGLQLKQLLNKKEKVNLLKESQSPHLFLVNSRAFASGSKDFTVTRVTLAKNKNKVIATIYLDDPKRNVNAELKISADESNAMVWHLTATNTGKGTRQMQLVFPQVGAIAIGGDAAENRYFYPQRSGIEGVIDCDLQVEYGVLAWFQTMSVYSPASRARLSIYPRDASGEFKGLAFKKTSSGSNPGYAHSSEIIYPQEAPAAQLLDFDNGCGMAWYYLRRQVKHGKSLESPDIVVTVGEGNWKDSLKEYCSWVRTWYKPLSNVPEWFRRSYDNCPMHFESFYSDTQKKYVGLEGLKGRKPDIVQWAFWDDYDRNYEPDKHLPDKSRYQPGDWKVDQTRGGLPPFKAEVKRFQDAGIRFTLYTDCRFIHEHSNIGKKFAKKWAAVYTGNQLAIQPEQPAVHCACLYEENAWMAYAAKRLGELVGETGIDGIYFDETNMAFPCYNTAHKHFRRNQLPQDIGLLSKNMTMIRNSVKAANPDAMLMTEHAASDYMSQFVDGSWVQTYYPGQYGWCEKYYDDQFLYFFHFYFPEFVLNEWGGGKHGQQRCFFNGIGRDGGFNEPLKRVLHEHADVFSSLDIEPHVKTLAENVLVNRFSKNNKTVYTIYNRRERNFDGELLALPEEHGKKFHYIDPLAEKPCPVNLDKTTGTIKVKAKVPARDIGGIVEFPRLLNVEKTASGWKVTVQDTYKTADLTVNGKAYGNFSNGPIEVKNSTDSSRIIFKLLKNKIVADMLIK
jgi:hypothetical protein